MELPHYGGELFGTSKFGHDFPEALSANSVVRLGEVDKGGEYVGILLMTLLLQLSGSKHHVDGPTFFPEATLALWQVFFTKMQTEAV